MRLWAWEEKHYKQERKRQVLWTVALICWAAALYLTYWVGHFLYGGIVETNTVIFLGASIGMPIGFGLRKAMGKEEKPMTKGKKWMTGILAAVSLVVIAWGVVFRERIVYVTQAVFVLLPLYWSDYEKKKDIDRISLYACTLFFAAVSLVAGTLAGGCLTGNETTGQAEKSIQAEGFTDVEFLGWMYGRWVYEYAVDKSFYQESMESEKYYMLFGKKDGAPWRFVVNPKGGEILIAAAEVDEPELGNWYRSRKTGSEDQ